MITIAQKLSPASHIVKQDFCFMTKYIINTVVYAGWVVGERVFATGVFFMITIAQSISCAVFLDIFIAQEEIGRRVHIWL